jgi:NADH-quinone oxidoreductase subunit G
MEGYLGQPPSPLITHYWASGWNSVQALNKFQSEVGGHLRQEIPGVRLIEPSGKSTVSYFADAPEPFQARTHGWLILPWYQIFGSDELSARASAVAERIPEPALILHPDDAAKLRVKAGERAELVLGETSHRVPVKLESAVPRGTAGLTIVPGFTDVILPTWSPVVRVAEP